MKKKMNYMYRAMRICSGTDGITDNLGEIDDRHVDLASNRIARQTEP